jgi:hypothetical protein
MRCIKYCKYIFKLVEIFPTNEDLPFRAKTTWSAGGCPSHFAIGPPAQKRKLRTSCSQAVGRTIRPLRVGENLNSWVRRERGFALPSFVGSCPSLDKIPTHPIRGVLRKKVRAHRCLLKPPVVQNRNLVLNRFQKVIYTFFIIN